MSSVPPAFPDIVKLVYSYCFKISRYLTTRKNQNENEEEDTFIYFEDGNGMSNVSGCPVCGKSIVSDSSDEGMNEDDVETTTRDPSMYSSTTETYACNCQDILESFEKMNQHLLDMQVLDHVCKTAVVAVVFEYTDKFVTHQTRSSFNLRIIEHQLRRVRKVSHEWLSLVYHKSFDTEQQKTLEFLVRYAYEVFSKIRISQLFDIIVEYPDSKPALEDLKFCIDKCFSFRSDVVDTLGKSFAQRLLHPGVATNDILTAYIQTIKALRLLDPTGVLLQLICDPLKTYLKGKDDTVRCIITALTDENSDLIPELVNKVPKTGDDTGSQSDDEYVVRNWQSWRPDPIDAAKASKDTRSVRSSDIVSILVDVYESKDLFVEEYQRLLSQRFLSTFECNIDFERRNLEILTLKFGESDLHACEVMLSDMTTSRRIDARINSGEISPYNFPDFPINCIIISTQFWPEKFCLPNYDEGENILLPEKVESAIASYTKAFETIKGSRTLQWRKNLGSVELDLEFGEKVVSLTVPPIQAVIITRFQEKSSWKLSSLSSVIGVSASLLRRKLVFWLNKGILKETFADEYTVIEDQSSNNSSCHPVFETDEDFVEEFLMDESSSVSKADRLEDDKYRSLWGYIENILTNLSDMTLEKIHEKLQMFALQGPSFGELSLQELRYFLDSKTREAKLTFSAGYYKLT
jgi:anaphase-promoting complex subunit 2